MWLPSPLCWSLASFKRMGTKERGKGSLLNSTSVGLCVNKGFTAWGGALKYLQTGFTRWGQWKDLNSLLNTGFIVFDGLVNISCTVKRLLSGPFLRGQLDFCDLRTNSIRNSRPGRLRASLRCGHSWAGSKHEGNWERLLCGGRYRQCRSLGMLASKLCFFKILRRAKRNFVYSLDWKTFRENNAYCLLGFFYLLSQQMCSHPEVHGVLCFSEFYPFEL